VNYSFNNSIPQKREKNYCYMLPVNTPSCVWKQGSWCRMYSLCLTYLKFIIQSLRALMESTLHEPQVSNAIQL